MSSLARGRVRARGSTRLVLEAHVLDRHALPVRRVVVPDVPVLLCAQTHGHALAQRPFIRGPEHSARLLTKQRGIDQPAQQLHEFLLCAEQSASAPALPCAERGAAHSRAASHRGACRSRTWRRRPPSGCGWSCRAGPTGCWRRERRTDTCDRRLVTLALSHHGERSAHRLNTVERISVDFSEGTRLLRACGTR